MTDELKDTLDRLRGELAEARRYVRTNPAEAVRMLYEIHIEIDFDLSYELAFHAVDRATLRRLAGNLSIALKYLLSMPDVCLAYMDGARFELQIIADRPRAIPASELTNERSEP